VGQKRERLTFPVRVPVVFTPLASFLFAVLERAAAFILAAALVFRGAAQAASAISFLK
jgi:hypothetical protein